VSGKIWEFHDPLLYVCFVKTENDILLRAELEDFAVSYPDRFHLWYTLDRPPEGLIKVHF